MLPKGATRRRWRKATCGAALPVSAAMIPWWCRSAVASGSFEPGAIYTGSAAAESPSASRMNSQVAAGPSTSTRVASAMNTTA